jgi:hypothetical protein
MTVAELFTKAGLTLHGPVRWGDDVPKADAGSDAGVYVVARVHDPNGTCEECALPFVSPFPPYLKLSYEYEVERWLSRESILYIGKTDQTIRKRIGQFYDHECGHRSPHAGGQIVKLLQCKMWVYWASARNPEVVETEMIRLFKEQAGKIPFANAEKNRRDKRIRDLR